CANLQATTSEVHRCLTADGTIHFVQFGCPPGTTEARTDSPDGLLSIVTMPKLDAAERKMLETLQSDLLEQQRRHRRERQKQARTRARERVEALAQCEKAERALDRLAVTRRKGYTAQQGRRFEDQERQWRSVKKSAC
ncbi:MAG: hypothetical protein ACC642_00570, partial [Pseudomonadales bacterium]